jgi:hypothetical protein
MLRPTCAAGWCELCGAVASVAAAVAEAAVAATALMSDGPNAGALAGGRTCQAAWRLPPLVGQGRAIGTGRLQA